MRKIIVSNVMSLDGFFEGTKPGLEWFTADEEFFEYARQVLRAADTLLFGRATYEHMAAFWPSAPADEIANHMNSLEKVVFTTTLPEASWNNSRRVSCDIGEEVARLKRQPGKDMVVFGSAMLASFLLREGLVDEYRVIIGPVLLGAGRPLFRDMDEKMTLELTDVRRFGSGVVLLSYRKTRDSTGGERKEK